MPRRLNTSAVLLLVVVSLNTCSTLLLLHSKRLPYRLCTTTTAQKKSHVNMQFHITNAAVEFTEQVSSKLQRKGIISFLSETVRQVKFDKGILKELSELWNPVDITYLAIPALVTGPLLHFLDHKRKERVLARIDRLESQNKYLLEYLEDPLIYLSKFPLWLFFLDVISAFIEAFGITFHVRANIPDLIAKLSGIFMLGLFCTRIKDWTMERWIRPSVIADSIRSDPVRSSTISELTSVFIWLVVALVGLEVASLKLGVTLGSIFACKYSPSS